MERTLQIINELENNGVITNYALGGATALLFYAEPALTYDIDVFVFLPAEKGSSHLIDLGPLYGALKEKGYGPEKEHILIEGVPVQFIPVYNTLVEEAVKKATVKNYRGVKVKVMGIEYLLAIMMDTNRPKDKERFVQLIREVKYNRSVLNAISKKYDLDNKWEK